MAHDMQNLGDYRKKHKDPRIDQQGRKIIGAKRPGLRNIPHAKGRHEYHKARLGRVR